MQTKRYLTGFFAGHICVALALAALTGCESSTKSSNPPPAPSAQATPSAPAAAAPAAAPTPAPAAPAAASSAATSTAAPSAPVAATAASVPLMSAIRIKAGLATGFKDADGNEWLPDQNFDGGETVERPDLEIKNTKTPAIYRAERYSMNGFSYPVPNGKYIVKLHFCETFEGITGPGERVFSFNVEGHEFKDFDVWKKTGGALTAYVETVPVEVADGKVDITFTPNVENPEINGIEIIPVP